MCFIAEFHRNGKLTKDINSTFVALILKVDSPQRLNDFRPISLVGSLYKILAKVLANRLRVVIGSVISKSHTTFVKDQQILYGILIANEVVDEARKSKKELMLFKVDFEKAYDSVDWGYLDAVMGRMTFPPLWRKWMRECVCTTTASVLVNGSPTEEFSFQMGLRQGDPLSPLLFLLAAEGLNALQEKFLFATDSLRRFLNNRCRCFNSLGLRPFQLNRRSLYHIFTSFPLVSFSRSRYFFTSLH
jgi:hypothetical protein